MADLPKRVRSRMAINGSNTVDTVVAEWRSKVAHWRLLLTRDCECSVEKGFSLRI
jgi:hypothetical protein